VRLEGQEVGICRPPGVALENPERLIGPDPAGVPLARCGTGGGGREGRNGGERLDLHDQTIIHRGRGDLRITQS
jgi:hypothetical protein